MTSQVITNCVIFYTKSFKEGGGAELSAIMLTKMILRRVNEEGKGLNVTIIECLQPPPAVSISAESAPSLNVTRNRKTPVNLLSLIFNTPEVLPSIRPNRGSDRLARVISSKMGGACM